MIVALSLLSSCNNKETTTPTRKNIEDAVFASGFIEQENQYTVSANADGILTTIPVSEGDIITNNTTVAVIKSDVQNNQLADAQVVYKNAVTNASANASILKQIQTNINQAKTQLSLDKTNYQRYKDLRAKNSVSQLDFEKAELQYKASKNNLLGLQDSYKSTESDLKLNEKRSLVQVKTQKAILDDYKLNSSISGTVINVFKKQGELIKRGEAIAEIGSGAFIIKLFVAEDDIKKVNNNQLVLVHLNTNPNETFKAKISKIYPSFNTTEQSYVVEAQFDQVPNKIFSGSQLQANIETGSSKNVLVIPTAYLIRENYVILENDEEIAIKTGRKNSDWTEVISGISEEDIIVKSKM
ncbi:efflux RND transporter periplasmic adaptor subunit [Winogradskyella sp. PG-2]|uniref:efflux RND transporter periplasmic adaptor subunit n=1 Tax=Winogradskyella sp. PG-2 TaxID=754409 RepID=UPI0004586289|nr:HlyD family efflux transporter periplasmic adaptor subunit [Winogradskyella sp. PG-2]BAO76398.1 membrane fusion efflux protein, putative [Winogradskyella sp. PG-2]